MARGAAEWFMTQYVVPSLWISFPQSCGHEKGRGLMPALLVD